jgi:hypothetical protein
MEGNVVVRHCVADDGDGFRPCAACPLCASCGSIEAKKKLQGVADPEA